MPNYKNLAKMTGLAGGAGAVGYGTGNIVATKREKQNQAQQARAFQKYNQKENQQLKEQYMRAGAQALARKLKEGQPQQSK